ncbi:gamma-taxilin [Hyposmocoma kahamanoa]|uniref:gamma-taxilin n=1 Tax=Hyposmocoma kahamanoa TaxID=1477025 RepID=UPI000E6D7D72|nr:gamma-taxilin [Hyposmocoma kahamanoa]
MEVAAEKIPEENTESAQAHNSNDDKTPSPPPNKPLKKSKKEDRCKSDDKNYEQFMKSLNSLPSTDQKFAAVCNKYSQASEDNKKLRFYIKQSDKRHALLMKEKEHLQHEFNKTILVKSKLENLCRELQKQNKAIKEESLLKIREEEERRKETQAKFQNTLSEITTLLQQNNEKNVKLRDDNNSMNEKFKSVVQQYQLREQQVDKMAKQMALESQLADAKLQKANLEFQAEKERIFAEMEQLKVAAAQYKAKILELQGTEMALKGQLAVYTDKYDEFQNALVKSNQVFGGFKEQMETMSKKIRKLEEESLSWKKRWEISQKALLDMCGERQTSEERHTATQRQLQHMQSLCRILQAERTVLLNTLKDNKIERPALPVGPLPVSPAQPPTPAPSPSDKKVDAMVANCAQLRQSLAHLQSQLNVLTTNKNGTKEEQPKPEKQKKSKSKKSKGEKQVPKSDVEKIDSVKESENSVEELSSVKEITGEIDEQQVLRENLNEATAETEEKLDEKTVENLIQALNMANVNLCSLEDGNYETNEMVNETTNEVVKDEELEIIKGENVEVVNDENHEKVHNISCENLKELNGVSPVEIVPNPQVEMLHIPELKSNSNEIP